jgi:hypothetical protein
MGRGWSLFPEEAEPPQDREQSLGEQAAQGAFQGASYTGPELRRWPCTFAVHRPIVREGLVVRGSDTRPGTKVARGRTSFAIPVALLILALTSLVLLTGCTVGVGLDTKVETDGSGTVSVRISADKALDDALSAIPEEPEDSGSFLDDLKKALKLDDVAKGLGGLGKVLQGLGKLGGALGGLEDLGGALGGLGDLGGGLGDLGQASGLIPGSVDELFDIILSKIPGDWKVERGTDADGTKWVALTRSFANPQELQEILASSTIVSAVGVDEVTLTQDQGTFSTKTRFSARADASGAMSKLSDAASGLGIDLLGESLVIENRVTLPGSIGENNADEVSGNTLAWNIGFSEARTMFAESTVYNWAAIIGVIIGGVIVVALVLLLVLLLLRRRRRSSPPQVTQPGVSPQGPAPE